MNLETARHLTISLIERLSPEGDAFRLPESRLSLSEVTALRQLAGLGVLERQVASPTTTAPRTDAQSFAPAKSSFKVNWTSFDASRLPEEELRLCLDFGTAMSKAWATGSRNKDTIPLMLGRPADGSSNLFVPSAIFISGNGRVYIGNAAEVQHRQELDTERALFDNIKSLLSDAEIGQEIDDVPVSSGVNPTRYKITKGDLVVLYLAWLTDIALQELREAVDAGTVTLKGRRAVKSGIRNVRRRYAIPCFATARDELEHGAQRAVWARKVMRRSISRAQIVADTFTGRWNEIGVQDVRAVMDEVSQRDIASMSSLFTEADSIREPIAAGASRFDEHFLDEVESTSSEAPQRRLMMVVDAGAGTTDFAVFQVVFDPASETTRYALVAPSVSMSRLAGNEVDRALRPLILKACGVDPLSGSPLNDDDFRIARNDLGARIREIKRSIFGSGQATISLRPRLRGTLSLKAVEADPAYQKLADELKADQLAILEGLFDDEALEPYRIRTQRFNQPAPIHVVLTGGSSNVPIFRELANRLISINGARFKLTEVQSVPAWVKSLPREVSSLLAQAYPQEAVAIGGSTASLPQEVNDLRTAVSSPREGKRVLERYQVKGV